MDAKLQGKGISCVISLALEHFQNRILFIRTARTNINIPNNKQVGSQE